MQNATMRRRLANPVVIGMLIHSLVMGAERYTVTMGESRDASRTPLILLGDRQANVEAAIAPSQGGELSGLSILRGDQRIETIYLDRDYSPRDDWTGKAPLLWPATGRNFPEDLEARRKAGEVFHDGAWIYKGRRYTMPIHGFARDFPWRVESKEALAHSAVATLSLSDTPASREYYPFGFRLEVTYRLRDGVLTIAYVVRAAEQNTGRMPFSIGNHITFNAPLIPGSDAAQVELFTPSAMELLKTGYGIPTGESRPRSHTQGIKLGDFERRSAVSLTRYEGDPHILYRDPQGLAIRMSHRASEIPASPIILFNLWVDAAGGFMSPEPWVGLQNSLVSGQGLIHLAPSERYEWTIEIELQGG